MTKFCSTVKINCQGVIFGGVLGGSFRSLRSKESDLKAFVVKFPLFSGLYRVKNRVFLIKSPYNYKRTLNLTQNEGQR